MKKKIYKSIQEKINFVNENIPLVQKLQYKSKAYKKDTRKRRMLCKKGKS